MRMRAPRGSAEIVLAVIVAVALGTFIAIFAIRNAVPVDTTLPAAPSPSPTPSPNSLLPIPAPPGPMGSPTLETFKHAYATGFEGVYFQVDYSLQFDPKLFAVHGGGSDTSLIYVVEKANNHTHSIRIVNNDGPGFTSAKDFFENFQKCYNCTEIKSTLEIPGAADIRTYVDASSTQSWVAFANPPGFILILFVEPSDAAKAVMKTLSVTSKQLVHTSCEPQGSCRYGEKCSVGTECSGLPAFGCYPLGCPFPQ